MAAAAAGPAHLNGLPEIDLTLPPITHEVERSRTNIHNHNDIKKNGQLTRAFISLPTVTNVRFDYDDLAHAPKLGTLKHRGSRRHRKAFNNQHTLSRVLSTEANNNTVDDVRVFNSLKETCKFYFKYPKLEHANSLPHERKREAENALNAGLNRDTSTYRRYKETFSQEEIRLQVIKMRDSISFAIDEIDKDKLVVFDGNSNNMVQTLESFFDYFDKNLFGKKNLCIDGQNIGYSMLDATHLVNYTSYDSTTRSSNNVTTTGCNLFFDQTKPRGNPNSPLSDIEPFHIVNGVGNALNIYGINYNVACKLIDLLSGCEEGLQFDNYVITMQRHSILDFFWSINTDHSHRRNVNILESIGPTTHANPSPICIKYVHRGKNIYFVSLPVAPLSGIPKVIGTESDDYLGMLVGLRYRSKFFTRDKFKWLDGIILKRLFTQDTKYDYYDNGSLFTNNNVIQYEHDKTIHLSNLINSHVGYLEEVPQDGIMYYPPIPSTWAATNPANIRVPRASLTMSTTQQRYYIRRTYIEDIHAINVALRQPFVQTQTIYDVFSAKINDFRRKTKTKTKPELIREITEDSDKIKHILENLQYYSHLIDTGVIRGIFLIWRRMLREISNITNEKEPQAEYLSRSLSEIGVTEEDENVGMTATATETAAARKRSASASYNPSKKGRHQTPDPPSTGGGKNKRRTHKKTIKSKKSKKSRKNRKSRK